MNGTHIVANFHDCAFDFQQENMLLEKAVEFCTTSGLCVLSTAVHAFAPQGITFVVLLAESHLSLHTWPEYQSAAFDLYVCNHSKNNSQACFEIYEKMRLLLSSNRVEKKVIERDDLFAIEPSNHKE